MKKTLLLALVFAMLAMVVPSYAAEMAVPEDLPYITSDDVGFIDYSGSDADSGRSASTAKKTFGTATSQGVVGLLTDGGTMVVSGKAYIPKSYTLPKTETPLLITSNYADVNYMNEEPIINPSCAFKMASNAHFAIESDVIFDDIIIFQEHMTATAFIVKNGATLVIGDGVRSMSKTGLKVLIMVESGGRLILGGGDFDVVCTDGGEVIEGYTYDYLKVEQQADIAEGDYGYYDVTNDGKVEIIDVFGVLQQVVDNPGNGGLLRVIRTLKLVTSGKVVTAIVEEIDAENKTITLLIGTERHTVALHKIGLDKHYDPAFYINGTVTMTVSGDDVSNVYAAVASCRYDINEIHLVADSTTALINGERQTLSVSPIMKDGVLMINAAFLAEKLEATVSWNNTTKSAGFKNAENDLEMTLDSTTATLNGETVTMDVPMITVDKHTYVPAAFVAQVFGAKVTFYEDTNTLVIVKQFLPTVYINDVSGKAGEEVSVLVALEHNPGVTGVQVELGYDASAISYTASKGLMSEMFTSTSPTAGANPVKIVMANLSLKNVVGDRDLATVSFAIAKDTVAGTNSVISFDDVQMYFVYNGEIYAMTAKTIPGTIIVTE